MLYNMLKRQVERKIGYTLEQAEDMQNKLDTFFLVGRITDEEYKELTELLEANTKKAE